MKKPRKIRKKGGEKRKQEARLRFLIIARAHRNINSIKSMKFSWLKGKDREVKYKVKTTASEEGQIKAIVLKKVIMMQA